ncbi:MAG TPA: flagellar basal body P-ring formation chaperone FlgA [Limnobacter sp.]|nr:flagellar basal body P-ring formation chaperone FlgA [Limnobacter sp.]
MTVASPGAATAGNSAAANVSAKWVTEDRLVELVDPALLPTGAHVDVKFVKADDRIGSSQCPAALFANTQGNRMWGRTFLRVQCVGSDLAPFFVGVDVKVWAPVLVMKNMVQAGQAVGAGDVEFRNMDLSQLTQGWLTELVHLNNRTAARQLWPGSVLKPDHLKGQALIKNGDTVKVMMKGPGFAIGGTAVALGEAEAGQVVKIKTGQGKILHGVAREALLVEVSL